MMLVLGRVTKDHFHEEDFASGHHHHLCRMSISVLLVRKLRRHSGKILVISTDVAAVKRTMTRPRKQY